MALRALDCGSGVFPVAMFLAAQSESAAGVVDILRLRPGDLEEVIRWTFSIEGQTTAAIDRLLDDGEVEGGPN